jgi:two-component system, LytTR family, response regulator
MIQAILADDEVLARQKLRQLLRAEPDVEIVGECATALETVELTTAARPDLLFLDIRMPGMDGFDIIGALARNSEVPMPSIIFTTAYDQYALRAFEVHALDYLLKPFTPERLQAAVQRVRERASADPSPGAPQAQDDSSSGHTTRMVFKSRGRILFLPVSEIRWIGAEENYVRLSTGNESHLLRETMTHLEQRLDPRQFLRVHRSFMVNLDYVKEVRTEDGDAAVIMHDGRKIAVSRNFKSKILEKVNR